MEAKGGFSGIWLMVFLFLLLPASALGTTVTNTNNSGGGSLRDAVANTPSGGIVDFDPGLAGSTIVLGTEIVIDKSLTIAGPGPGLLTVSGNNVTRIFNIIAGQDVTISGLRLFNGSSTIGAAINNGGALNLVINNCVFESNTASCTGSCFAGAAVFEGLGGTGTLSVSDSSFLFNRATCDGNNCFVLGAGLGNGSGGDFEFNINNCIFRSNTASCSGDCFVIGAGVANGGGGTQNFHILNNTFDSNNSSCDGDTCFVVGSGVANGGGGVLFFEITNNTFYSNIASCSGIDCFVFGAGFGNGGGGLTSDVFFNTFSRNSVFCSGDGCDADGASISSSDTRIDSNIFFTDSLAGNCTGGLTSLGYNIDSDGTCVDGSSPGDQPFTDPGLVSGPPRNNGGPTPTIALLGQSPAIDAGDPACPPPDTDQRGVTRPQLQRCDTGSYELESLGVIRPIPTLSEWGMIAAAVGLGLIGVFFAVRRKRISQV